MNRGVGERYLRRPYTRMIVPDDEGRYSAQILEFPGCISDGESPEEAYTNLEEAGRNWVESAREQGMRIPQPFAVQGFSGTISLRLPKSIHRRAAELAHRDGVSLNQFLVTAIAARVGAEDLIGTISAKLDERIDRLQTVEFVQFQGLMQRLPIAANIRERRLHGDIGDLHKDSATLPAAPGVLDAEEEI